MLTTFVYDDSPIQFEVIEGHIMANATLMCQVFRARPNDWQALKSTRNYLEAITRKNGISENQLVTSRLGAPENGGGTWIHEKLILNLARWLDTDFELWCDEKISELLSTGTASLSKMTPAEMLLMQAQQLVNHERQIRELELRQVETEAKVVEIVNHMQTRPNYFCVTAFCATHGIRVNKETAKRIGRKSASLCKQRGYEIGSVTDDKWGKVGSYPNDVLLEVFQKEGLLIKKSTFALN